MGRQKMIAHYNVCEYCGSKFWVTTYKESARKTCSDECLQNLRRQNSCKAKSKPYVNEWQISEAEQMALRSALRVEHRHPASCSYCPLNKKYEKDAEGNYVCGIMSADRQSSGMRYIKVPDSRCKA